MEDLRSWISLLNKNFISYYLTTLTVIILILTNMSLTHFYLKNHSRQFGREIQPESTPHCNIDLALKRLNTCYASLGSHPLKADPQLVEPYIDEIMTHMKKNEIILKKDYMSIQNEVNSKMRAILIDWLIDVQLKFKLKDETLFMTV